MADPRLIRHPSPNCGPRRDGALPDIVVIHYTAMQGAEAALDRLCDPAAEVSAHYLIGADGSLWQMVDETMRAWHAGAGQWGGVTDVNSRSIGIELDNRGDHPFAAAQMRALEGLLVRMRDRWAIPPERVIAHSDMAPARKIDPGPRFDWRALARCGLSVWPEAAAPTDPGGFRAACTAFGYPGAADIPDTLILQAFRARFRPGVSGPLDGTDAALAADLARRFPVDRAGLTA